MNTLNKKYRAKRSKVQIGNKRASDPFDRLIFEDGLRIRRLVLDKGLDLMLLVLTNGAVIKSNLSDFPKLKKATAKELDNFTLIGEGVAIEWPGLDEDLSLKGFIKDAYKSRTLRALKGSHETIFA